MTSTNAVQCASKEKQISDADKQSQNGNQRLSGTNMLQSESNEENDDH